ASSSSISGRSKEVRQEHPPPRPTWRARLSSALARGDAVRSRHGSAQAEPDFEQRRQGRQDSNLQPPVLETGALPIELRPCMQGDRTFPSALVLGFTQP